MKSVILAIRIIGDATSAVAAMDKAQRASMSFKDKVGKASVAASAALAAIGAGAAATCNSRLAASKPCSVIPANRCWHGARTRPRAWA